jgi:hypothetical protein
MPSEKVLCACGCYIARNGINIKRTEREEIYDIDISRILIILFG